MTGRTLYCLGFLQIYRNKRAQQRVLSQKYINHANLLSFHTCANLLSILEIDLAQCPLEWNHARTHGPGLRPVVNINNIATSLPQSANVPRLNISSPLVRKVVWNMTPEPKTFYNVHLYIPKYFTLGKFIEKSVERWNITDFIWHFSKKTVAHNFGILQSDFTKMLPTHFQERSYVKPLTNPFLNGI